MDDLPPELMLAKPERNKVVSEDWEDYFKNWVENCIKRRESNIAKNAISIIESILIEAALGYTRGRRQDAAKVLGYGRNTLTRKIKELGLGLGDGNGAA